MNIKRFIGLCATALTIVGTTSSIALVPASAMPQFPGTPPLPEDDPFYAQPESLDGKAMGEVVDSRAVSIPQLLTTTEFSAWQLKYVSQDTEGKPWTNMAIVLRPARPTRTALLSFQFWIDTLSSHSNPSYELRAGLAYQTATSVNTEAFYLARALDRGWTIVVPDHLGPFNEFGAGYVEGRNTLDGIRAVENFAPAGLSGASTPTVLYGYSGGASSTEIAAELAPKYAPELNIRGAAANGLPIEGAPTSRSASAGPMDVLKLPLIFGIGRAYPGLHIGSYFTDPNLEASISQLSVPELLARFPSFRMTDHTVGGIQPMETPEASRVAESLRAGNYGTPTAPIYLMTGVNDEFTPIDVSDRFAADYCARGVDITYVKVPVIEHFIGGAISEGPSLDWLAQRLDGAASTSTCGAPDHARVG